MVSSISPPLPASDAVTLVVGSDGKFKNWVADGIADGCGALEADPTAAGIRKFTKEASSEVVVVDTLPFDRTYLGKDIVRHSRQWISRNSLRRMRGKPVRVVGVLTEIAAHENIDDDPNFYTSVYSWLRLLGFIFKENRQAISFIVVKPANSSDVDDEPLKLRVEQFIKLHGFSPTNICYVSCDAGPITLAENVDRLGEGTDSQVHFSLKEVSPDASNMEKFGPWGPERLILFGRSGSGKSTLAQMLTLGKLDPFSNQLVSNPGIRGETRSIAHGEGRGWYIVDSPGFGEPNDKLSTTPSEDAEKKMKKYVQTIGGIYTHYIYVVMKGRIDKLEISLWGSFVKLFGENIKDHFTVVVSKADQTWVEENLEHLKLSFAGCESFLSADFPSVELHDEEWEREYVEIRTESLRDLEDGLSSLERIETWCNFGAWSKTSIQDVVSIASLELQEMKSGSQKARLGANLRAYRASTTLHRFSMMFTDEDEIVLLPPADD